MALLNIHYKELFFKTLYGDIHINHEYRHMVNVYVSLG